MNICHGHLPFPDSEVGYPLLHMLHAGPIRILLQYIYIIGNSIKNGSAKLSGPVRLTEDLSHQIQETQSPDLLHLHSRKREPAGGQVTRESECKDPDDTGVELGFLSSKEILSELQRNFRLS